jgi:hypothetical protein
MRGAGAYFHIDGLQQGATMFTPIRLEFENNVLESQHET